jgi:hypothetical protein
MLHFIILYNKKRDGLVMENWAVPEDQYLSDDYWNHLSQSARSNAAFTAKTSMPI